MKICGSLVNCQMVKLDSIPLLNHSYLNHAKNSNTDSWPLCMLFRIRVHFLNGKFTIGNKIHQRKSNVRDSILFRDMNRLNSGNRNQNIFLIGEIFIFQNTVADSVNFADSGEIEFSDRFPGNMILKFLRIF